MVMAYIEDLRAARLNMNDTTKGVLPIIEIGAGTGQFTFHFLQQFYEAYRLLGEAPPSIQYIATDISRKNIDFWKQHPQFQTFIERGVLDFAYFDMCADTKLNLEMSGQSISAETAKMPMVVIANYVFDSIPQDVFEQRNGQLFAGLIETQQSEDIGGLHLEYKMTPCTTNFYAKPSWNAILGQYPQLLDNGFFPFPTAGLEFLDKLVHFSDSQFLLLTADKGHHLPKGLTSPAPPELSKHGSFSMRVNYHALIEYATQSPAEVLCTAHAYTHINVLAFLYGKAEQTFRHAKRMYHLQFAAFGPDDFFLLKSSVEKNYHTLSLKEILLILRLSHWDPDVLIKCWDRLVLLLPRASGPELYNLREGIGKIKERYFMMDANVQWVQKIDGIINILQKR